MHKNRSLPENLGITLRGIAMGAADVVPGVSGGTIAFITGIYDELIDSINSVNLKSIQLLFKEGFASFWKAVNGTFIVFLLSGIFVSILSLAKLITYLMEKMPIPLWSFFFGLIISSAWLVSSEIKNKTWMTYLFFVIGLVFAFWLSNIQVFGHANGLFYLFISGAIAICAMILPGISGSFILVILGSYHIVLDAVKSFQIKEVAVFAIGCLIGILSFSRLLKFVLSRFRDITIAMLIGFMIGSLSKVWPWKLRVGDEPFLVHSNGREEWLTANVWPSSFDGNPQIFQAILFFTVGILLIVAFSLLQRNHSK